MPNETDERRWEYLTIPESARHHLGQLGTAGWELVATGSGPGESVLYLKRPAPSFRERITLEQRRHVFQAHGLDAALDGEREQ